MSQTATSEEASLKTWIAAAGGAALALVLIGFSGLASIDPVDADYKADWIVGEAALTGDGAYSDLTALADRFGVDYRYNSPREVDFASHPRSPGALLLLTPLTLLPYDRIYQLALLSSIAAIMIIVVISANASGASTLQIALAVPVALLAEPSMWTYRFATQLAILGLLIAVVYISTQKGDRWYAGTAVGVASTLKLFPLLLVIPIFLAWKKKAALSAIGSLAVLTVIGAALPGVDWSQSITALREAVPIWFDLSVNLSFAKRLSEMGMNRDTAIAVTLVLGLVVLWSVMRRSQRQKYSLPQLLTVTMSLALLMSPLFWPPYIILLYPGLMWQLREVHSLKSGGILYGAAVGLLLLPHQSPTLMTGGVVLLIASVLSTPSPRMRRGIVPRAAISEMEL